MVKSVSSLTQSGVRDFLIQRLTAIYMAVFLIGFAGYLVLYPVTDFYSWHILWNSRFLEIAMMLFLVFLTAHTWVGMWMIATDYLKDYVTRLIFLVIVLFTLLACLAWGIVILWGR